jgi:hypothetical protein
MTSLDAEELDRLIPLARGVFSSTDARVPCLVRPVMAEWNERIEFRYLPVSIATNEDVEGKTDVVCSL